MWVWTMPSRALDLLPPAGAEAAEFGAPEDAGAEAPLDCAAGSVEVTTGAVDDGVKLAVPSSTVM